MQMQEEIQDEMDAMYGRSMQYILTDNHQAIPVTFTEYIKWQTKRGTTEPVRVGFTTIKPGVEVSTVFLGLNHAYDPDGPPMIFETMVFGGVCKDIQVRYSTWDEAKAGHAEIVMKVRQEEFREGNGKA